MCFPWFKKKPKKRLIEDECAICLGVILRRHEQCPNCNIYMHETCLIRWKYQCKNQSVPYTCPICRWEYK